jgi:hypothetical protein
MSPKRESIEDLKETPPKREMVSDKVIAAPDADTSDIVYRLGIPPLPNARRELFKVAMEALPDGDQKSETQSDIAIKRTSSKKPPQDDLPKDIIGRFTNAAVHLISKTGSFLFVFPLPICKTIDDSTGSFISYTDFCSLISDRADGELVSCGLKAVFVHPKMHYGSKLELYIETFDGNSSEYLMNENNYVNLLVSTYAVHGKLVFKLHSPFEVEKNESFPRGSPKMSPKSSVRNDQDAYHDPKYGLLTPQQNNERTPILKKETKIDIEQMTNEEFFTADNVVREDVTIDNMLKRANPPYGYGSRNPSAGTSMNPDVTTKFQRHHGYSGEVCVPGIQRQQCGVLWP